MSEPLPTLRRAVPADVPAVTALVQAAYLPWVERVGGRPGPLDDDYDEIVRRGAATVAVVRGHVVGVVVLAVDGDGFGLQNVAVLPSWHGRGVGRLLLQFAEEEARRAGADSIHLYTHERMTQNQDLYRRIGYVEFARRRFHFARRVHMRKMLG